MPRKNRVETVYDGSVHHITQRGLNKQGIFRTNEDYSRFKDFIGRYLKQFSIRIYNYCLMPNHSHMLVFTEETMHLSKFVQAIALSYGAYYRSKYDYTGYLWQGRFKNFLIEKDSYLLECGRYIERNPLRAKLRTMESLSQFQWSSYNFYTGGVPDDIITINPIYATMGETPKEKQERYREYILTSRPYEELLDDAFIYRRSGS